MTEKKKTLTLETFIGDMVRTGVDTTIRYLYENREAISNTLVEKLEDLVARKEDDADERAGAEPVRRIEVTGANDEEE